MAHRVAMGWPRRSRSDLKWSFFSIFTTISSGFVLAFGATGKRLSCAYPALSGLVLGEATYIHFRSSPPTSTRKLLCCYDAPNFIHWPSFSLRLSVGF
ncbi:hypothetical protein BJ912DRAFT_963601 [Pholiota molesta]|nr:hypothetical protein BJ912DRAFT_963601 [Pholiota molesta]